MDYRFDTSTIIQCIQIAIVGEEIAPQSEEQKKNVQKAIKQINDSFDKRNIKMNTADLTLLPSDFDRKSPDNFLLSVALKYIDENPIMLTSDNGLQIKAKGLGITTITLKEFLKQTKH